MSSHHFVKEGQEPALLCLDPQALSYEHLGALLAWVPVLMADIRCLDTLLDWQVKVDVLLCREEEREAVMPRLVEQAPVSILCYQRPEEALASSLLYLRAKQHDSLTVAVEPWRLEAAWLQGVAMLAGEFPITVYSRLEKGFACSGNKLEKWLAAGTRIRLLSTLHVMDVHAKGLPSEQYSMQAGEWLELEAPQDGKVSIMPAQEGLWFFEEVFAP